MRFSTRPKAPSANTSAHRHRRGLLSRAAALLASDPPRKPVHPALVEHAHERAAHAQDRLADRITTFAGSMKFVFIHVVWFGSWIAVGVEDYPFGLLTMIVSLEAIFLSTFVMISQNRADAKRQVIADAQWQMVQEESVQNEQLLDLSRQILALAQEVAARGPDTAEISGPERARAAARPPARAAREGRPGD